MRRRAAAVLVVLALAGCGDATADAPPTVDVTAGSRTVALQPTQFCLDGDGQRYSITPPIIEVEPDTAITLRVPEAVATSGWSVQVFDDQLEETIGEVDVPDDTRVFSEITSSDVVPPGFYLVVVQRSSEACNGLAGAWPVGFVRAGGPLDGGATTTAPATPSG